MVTRLRAARAKAGDQLGFIEPQLLTPVDEPPEGDLWEHELKYDGYRTQLIIENGVARAFTRNGFDWSDRYPGIVAAATKLTPGVAIIDGEVIVQDQQGRSDFGALRSAISRRPFDLVFYAFDLLWSGDGDLRKRSLTERRSGLHDLVGKHDPASPIQFSSSLAGSGADLFAMAFELGLEGIVSKRVDSKYRSGRSATWLKIKCFREEVLTVIGVERTKGPTMALLARKTPSGYEYAGSAMLTLTESDRDLFWARADAIGREAPIVSIPKKSGAKWLDPIIQVGVQTLQGERKLRHATIRELIA
jgi:DNA ligase D-like protein (predicted ligase)